MMSGKDSLKSHVLSWRRKVYQTGKMLYLMTGHSRSSGQQLGKHGYRRLIAWQMANQKIILATNVQHNFGCQCGDRSLKVPWIEVADPGGQGTMAVPELTSVWRNLWELLSTWLSVLALAMIKFFTYLQYRNNNVQYSLLQELQWLWGLSHSQPGRMSDWAGVLEVWTWTYYSAEANTQIKSSQVK